MKLTCSNECRTLIEHILSFLTTLTWINTRKHIGKEVERCWKCQKKRELVFSAIGALKNTLKTMGMLGRMLKEIKECNFF